MMNMDKELLIKKVICEDANIAEELERCESVEEFRDVFAKRAVELSEEESVELVEKILVAGQDGELTEADLENVAGGLTLKQAIWAFKMGARVGIAARMVYDYYKHGNAYKNYTLKQLMSGKFWS